MLGKQLSLSVGLDDAATFDNFYRGGNGALLHALECFLQDKDDHFMYLCGSHGCGRTHLLQAACHARHQMNQTAMYIPLGQGEFSPAILDGLEQVSLVCLDDLDSVLGDPLWEEALFHLYNRMRDTPSQLVVVGRQLPSKLEQCLPDLRSRLCWGLVFQLVHLTDDEKYSSIRCRAERRGFELGDDVCDFLLHRYPRDTHALYDLLDLLDEQSLKAQRKITIPFVKEVLREAKLDGHIS